MSSREGVRTVVHGDEFAPFPKGSDSGRYTLVAVGGHLFATTVGFLHRVRAGGRKEYPRWFGGGCVLVEDDGD